MPHGAPGFIDKNAVAKAAECLPFGQYRIWILFCSRQAFPKEHLSRPWNESQKKIASQNVEI
jgi:hypothetical protein